MNFEVNKILVKRNITIKDALTKMDEEAKGILLVVNDDEKLIGTLTDGDIRRALLRGIGLDAEIDEFIHKTPATASIDMNREEIKDIFIKKAIKQLPIIDEFSKVVDLISINDVLIEQGKENIVIVMAGGIGTRLKDLTKEIPKPMLKIGNDPILQHIINSFKQYGYNKIFISVNYKSEVIENYFQDGYAHGVKIKYLKENKRLGTGGGIKLARGYINKSFFVINGDIFTNLNFEKMMEFHNQNQFDMTVGIRKHNFTIPYGVINLDSNNEVINLTEKPEMDYCINAGIYCLKPEVVEHIPDNEYFEITDLINICLKNKKRIGSFEISDYWMDIGQVTDYYRLNEDYNNMIIK